MGSTPIRTPALAMAAMSTTSPSASMYPRRRSTDRVAALAVTASMENRSTDAGPAARISLARASMAAVSSPAAGPPWGGLYLIPPSSGGLCDGVRIRPSAGPPPSGERLDSRMAREMTGVGVYGDAASSRSSTPSAASTPTATSNACSESAWVSFPTNMGPSTRRCARCSATARAMTRIWASLKVASSELPRWPEVPNDTRWAGSEGSG